MKDEIKVICRSIISKYNHLGLSRDVKYGICCHELRSYELNDEEFKDGVEYIRDKLNMIKLDG